MNNEICDTLLNKLFVLTVGHSLRPISYLGLKFVIECHD